MLIIVLLWKKKKLQI